MGRHRGEVRQRRSWRAIFGFSLHHAVQAADPRHRQRHREPARRRSAARAGALQQPGGPVLLQRHVPGHLQPLRALPHHQQADEGHHLRHHLGGLRPLKASSRKNRLASRKRSRRLLAHIA